MITVRPQALSANVRWRFAENVENCIKGFSVEAAADRDEMERIMPVSVSKAPYERSSTFYPLKPSNTYHVKVVAEYEDGVRVESKVLTFKTLGTVV